MEFDELGETQEISLKVSEAVGLLKIEAVLEVPVEGLGVSPPRVEAPEVRIPRRDCPQVLGPVEAPCLLFGGVVHPDGDLPGRIALRHGVLVVEAVGGLVLLTLGSDSLEGNEQRLSVILKGADPEGAVLGQKADRDLLAVIAFHLLSSMTSSAIRDV